MAGQVQFTDKGQGFPAGCAVAHGHCLDPVPVHQICQGSGRLIPFGIPGMGENHVVMTQVCRGIQAHDLAPGSEPRINGQDRFSPKGGASNKSLRFRANT